MHRIVGDNAGRMPSPTDISTLTAHDLLELYRRKALSPVEVARDALARIERFEPAINAFVRVEAEAALAQARASEARWLKGEPIGRVDGLPATVKDNIDVEGLPSRKGSRTTPDAAAAADAPAVAHLRAQGAVFLGKTTLPEWGWIGVCQSPLTGITRNPWARDRTTGGSSGGAAASALLNLGVLHLGTDGAGSIRIPAAFTGVFGIKPSYGRVAAYPASPFGVLAHQGPLTRNVADAALMLSVIAGPDARDATAWNTPAPDFAAGLEDGVRGYASPGARGSVTSSISTRRSKRRLRTQRACLPSSARRSTPSIPASPSRSTSSARSGSACPRPSSTPCRPRGATRWMRISAAWPSRGGALRWPIISMRTRVAPSSTSTCAAFTSATISC